MGRGEETQRGGGTPAAAVPRGGRDKGPAGGPARAVFMLVGIKRRKRRSQSCGSAVRGAPARGAGSAPPAPRFVRNPRLRGGRPFVCAFRGRAPPGPAEHQLNAGLQPSPSSQGRSTELHLDTPACLGKGHAPPPPPQRRRPSDSSHPTVRALSPPRWGRVQASGDPSPKGPDLSRMNPSFSRATSPFPPTSPITG